MIPTINETATRFPLGTPLAASPDSPLLQAAGGFAFLLFLIGAVLQVRRLKSQAGHDQSRNASEMSASTIGDPSV